MQTVFAISNSPDDEQFRKGFLAACSGTQWSGIRCSRWKEGYQLARETMRGARNLDIRPSV